ncbi:hypothetical protein [Pseudoruegeria sp. HB172150]|uniref:hypothetical protein n=1 Tax=Pseudoruegeria sp. HB172150 TaxID=2721164 RepID=UPI001554F2A6|nr:hypothetical protein [Pseudoruegeria sp. HB172150]
MIEEANNGAGNLDHMPGHAWLPPEAQLEMPQQALERDRRGFRPAMFLNVLFPRLRA